MQLEHEQKLSLKQVFLPRYAANPYPLYQQLRRQGAVFWDEVLGNWVITGYSEVLSVLRDAHMSAARFEVTTDWIPAEWLAMMEPPIRALTRQMLFLDPPDHSRLRGLVAKAFTPRVVEAMRVRIQQLVDELLDVLLARGQSNLIEDFAYPLPAIVIAEMLGVPPEDREQFVVWTGNFGAILEGRELTMEEIIQAFVGVNQFMQYFREIIAQRRTQPKPDLLQAMISAEEGGDVLSEEELLGNCVLLLAAGHGTTTHLIGNGMMALLQHPQQYQLLKEHPEIISSAVQELLRYDGPVQATSRRAKEDVVLGGKQIQAGQNVLVSLGSANHDPAQFADSDQLHLQRLENRHLSFGQGIHFCLGAPLARLEAEIAFNTLLRRLPQPHLEEERVEWETGMVFRGLKTLPLLFA